MYELWVQKFISQLFLHYMLILATGVCFQIDASNVRYYTIKAKNEKYIKLF